MENALGANSQDVKEQYEQRLNELQQAYGEAMLELRARKTLRVPAGRGRVMIEPIRQGLQEGRFHRLDQSSAPLVRCAAQNGVLPSDAPATEDPGMVLDTTQTVGSKSTRHSGTRTVAHLLRSNRNPVQRIFQLKRGQVRTRPMDSRPL